MQYDFKYADLLNDDVFKLVFGQESSKDVMIEFLNRVITDRVIVDLDFMDKEMKTLEDCVTAQDRMLYVLKNLGRLKNRPQWLQNEIYECIFRACEISAFTEEKRIEYEKEMNDEKRLNGMMRAKLEEGIEQGIEKGIEQGVSQTIRQFHAKGMPASQIAYFLDMSLDQVESILAEK